MSPGRITVQAISPAIFFARACHAEDVAGEDRFTTVGLRKRPRRLGRLRVIDHHEIGSRDLTIGPCVVLSSDLGAFHAGTGNYHAPTIGTLRWSATPPGPMPHSMRVGSPLWFLAFLAVRDPLQRADGERHFRENPRPKADSFRSKF